MQPETLEGFRLSPQQERLWHLQRGAPGDGAPGYRALGVVAATHLAAAPLEAALLRLAGRHEILRTRFQGLPGMAMPLQVIGGAELAVERHDLSAVEPAAQRERLEALWQRLAGDPFDLAAGPALRAALAELGPGRLLLLLALPALTADAATLEGLVRELANLLDPTAAPAGEEPLQYADIAEWQQELLDAAAAAGGAHPWENRDGGGLDAELPFARPVSPAGSGFAPRSLPLTALRPLGDLQALGERLGSDVEAVLLACWQLLLHRLRDERPTTVGVACDGRARAELGGAFGPLTKYLPLACEGTPEAPFEALVAQTDRRLRELRRWQEPYAWQPLAAAGEVDGRAAHGCIPFCFELVRLAAPWRAGGATLALERVRAHADRFVLKLTCTAAAGALAAELHYDPALVRPEDAARLGGWFAVLLDGAASRPRAAVADLDLMEAAERRHFLHELNATAFPYPAATLVDLWRERAAASPARTALAWSGGRQSYGDLGRRVAALAHRLRRLGVAPEEPVALAVERSPAMVVGMLAICAAGGAWVPLDPAYPRERLEYMLADCGARLIVTQPELAGLLPGAAARRLCLDRDGNLAVSPDGEGAAPETPEAPSPEAPEASSPQRPWAPAAPLPGALAYVIYTSGSSGRPKGVMVSHSAIVNRLRWMQRLFPLASDDVVLQKTPYSFDASIWEIFSPLLAGACMALAEPGGHQDPAYLVQAVAEHGVTVLQLVPTLLAAFLDVPEAPASCRGLRRLFCGGEALPADLMERGRRLLGAELCNLYGPTEAAIDATFHRCAAAVAGAIAPIGRPLDNVEVYLLDRRALPVPGGLPGELAIGGAGVARGYLRQPALTAERFVPDPFSGRPGGRLYRTGDLARWDGGRLEFLGRGDHQIKLRGFRIELGEIEAVLRREPGVHEAVVVARQAAGAGGGGAEAHRLIAYVVAGAGQPAAEAWRRALAATLPDHMVPRQIVVLSELPRLPNGKLDRRALPDPDAAAPHAAAAGDRAAPRDPLEELLATVWCELLDLPRAGVHDDFFAAGGHSLLATRLVSRLRDLLRVELRVRDIFATPTIAGLAATLRGRGRGTGAPAAPPLRAGDRQGDAPLSFAQQRLWFLDRLAPGSAAYNLPAALELRGRLDPTALDRAWAEIVRRHESLRTRFAERDGVPAQRVTTGPPPAPARIDLRGLAEESGRREAERLARRLALAPFALAAAPPVRVALVRLAEQRHVALFVLHHIVSDGWSMGLLVRELCALYRTFAAGRPSPLPELPIQYGDYALWQREWLRGEVLEREIAHWRGRLGGEVAALDLPLDRPRPAAPSWRGAIHRLAMDADLAVALRAVQRAEGMTSYMVLLAAFEALLGRTSGAEAFTLGTPIAGRNRTETEGLIGFFVNTLVLRADLAGDPTFSTLLARVREETLDAYAHQDLPFEKLVEELAPRRLAGRSPLFQVMFVFQGSPLDGFAPDLPGLALSPLPIAGETAKFDLTLSLWEEEGKLAGGIEYSRDLFDPGTVERLATHLGTLLAGAVADPGARLSDLPLLTAGELHQVLHDWSGARREPLAGAGATLSELLTAQAGRRPRAIAAVAPDGCPCTYRELDARVSHLAAHLAAAAVGAESRVGIALDRSLDWLVAVLAVGRAGGAFVPLDPGQPRHRQERIMADAGIELLLTRSEMLPAPAVAGTAPPTFCLDRLAGSDTGTAAAGGQGSAAGLDRLAYVLYTSGSTGTPKGVAVTHRGIGPLAAAQVRGFDVRPGDQVLQFAALGFDAAVSEIAMTLHAGATLHLASAEALLPGPGLLDLLRARRITTWTVPPSALAALPAADLSDLRTLVVAGESCPAALVERWGRGRRFVNAYGPTEATVCATLGEATPGAGSPPIGRPIAGTAVYLLDRHLRPVPPGAVGELHVGGIGLARGYLGRPDATAAAFVPDPWGEPGSRLYRTGDLARQLPGGSLVFLARRDRQLKVRGFRIEPGEIEAALAEHPAVREVAVQAWAERGGEPRLVAWLAAAGPRPAPPPAELRDWLRGRLPAYMVPASFVCLAALPRLPSGKLDRHALPDPETSAPAAVAPRTPIEEALAEIWAEVLERERVGVRDDFFELGGHSLVASRVVARIGGRLGVELPVADLFVHPTVEALAARIEERLAEAVCGRPDADRVDELLDLLEGLDESDLATQAVAEPAARSHERS